MSDDKTLTGPRDAARINMHEDYEVRYWTGKLKVTEEQLRQAVKAVGNSSAAVRRHLGK